MWLVAQPKAGRKVSGCCIDRAQIIKDTHLVTFKVLYILLRKQLGCCELCVLQQVECYLAKN